MFEDFEESRNHRRSYSLPEPDPKYPSRWATAQKIKTNCIAPSKDAQHQEEKEYARIPYKYEKDAKGFFFGDWRIPAKLMNRYYDTFCLYCLVNLGEYHLPYCENERCPACQGQIVSCDCAVDILHKKHLSR